MDTTTVGLDERFTGLKSDTMQTEVSTQPQDEVPGAQQHLHGSACHSTGSLLLLLNAACACPAGHCHAQGTGDAPSPPSGALEPLHSLTPAHTSPLG